MRRCMEGRQRQGNIWGPRAVSGHDFSRAIRAFKTLGFSPCALLLFQVQRPTPVLIRRARQACFHRVDFDVLPVLLKALLIDDAHVGESALPDLAGISQFFFGAKGKSALDQLHCLFNAHLPRDRHQDVNVIGHDHEVVYANSPGPHGRTQNINEQIGHAFCLEKGFAARRPGGYEERSFAACGIVGA